MCRRDRKPPVDTPESITATITPEPSTSSHVRLNPDHLEVPLIYVRGVVWNGHLAVLEFRATSTTAGFEIELLYGCRRVVVPVDREREPTCSGGRLAQSFETHPIEPGRFAEMRLPAVRSRDATDPAYEIAIGDAFGRSRATASSAEWWSAGAAAAAIGKASDASTSARRPNERAMAERYLHRPSSARFGRDFNVGWLHGYSLLW